MILNRSILYQAGNIKSRQVISELSFNNNESLNHPEIIQLKKSINMAVGHAFSMFPKSRSPDSACAHALHSREGMKTLIHCGRSNRTPASV